MDAEPSNSDRESAGELPSGGGRIAALDVARGFALLGIFLVNIEYMAQPLGTALLLGAPDERGLSLALWWLVETFCEGKFYPLFSLLFGMGFALQRASVERSRLAFVPLYLRRVAFLAALGLGHGLLLWYGDILFVYAVTAALLLVVSPLPGRVLVLGGVGVLALAVLASAFYGAMAGASPARLRTEVAELPEIDEAPLEVLLQQLRGSALAGPEEPSWRAAEVLAYREGPWIQAQAFRAVSYGLLLVSFAAGGGLQIAAMFLIGAGLVRLDLFGAGRVWLVRLAALGLGVGLPAAVVSTLLGGWGLGAAAQAAALAGQAVAGAALALGWLGCAHGLAVLAERGARWAARLAGWLAAAGRMALTNYLLQTVIATAVMYHWGLARFGEVDRPSRVGLVLGVFVVQIAVSRLWLARFRSGPLEWLWRSFTYGARQPMLRDRVLGYTTPDR